MSKKKYLFFMVGLMMSLCACTSYVDTRREAGQLTPVGQSSPQRIAICYNPMFGSEAERLDQAKQACASGKARFEEAKYFNCALFYPNTAFYKCE